ncbi:hypothetical protein EUGRSUZ_J01342 [Eucalyptus grandis]|uniref:Uncharacterized protein n=2 Tax=Eucalyptus grandis TaxID=71139 RepID=A0ACC3K081_EUCGR|nr:hypothetical protein EUGRSUZ_J01342 [Eucalyptus grandis]
MDCNGNGGDLSWYFIAFLFLRLFRSWHARPISHEHHSPTTLNSVSISQGTSAQNHVFSFTPKSHNNLEKSRDLEFDFWVPGEMRNHHSRNCDPDPPTLRKLEKMSVSIAKDHHYSNLSPSSRTRRIEEGRREMMEMIRNLPESSYELSLKDIVDKQLPLQENQEEEEEEFEFPSAEEEEEFEFPSAEAESNKNQKRKKRKKVPRTTSHQHHQVSRCNSMETGTFLIKMFFPSFLASSKNPATSWNSRLKISRRTLFEGLDQRSLDTVSRINTSPVAGDQGSRSRDRTESSTSRSNSYKRRNHDSDSFLGCWPFPFAGTEGKMRRQRTCVF